MYLVLSKLLIISEKRENKEVAQVHKTTIMVTTSEGDTDSAVLQAAGKFGYDF